MKRFNRNATAAFTLLEIMLVVIIIALLAGSAIYLMKDSVGFAKDTRVNSDIQTISTALLQYESASGGGPPPTTEQGLAALVNLPTSQPIPRKWRRILTELPVDPWGQQYYYEYPARRSSKDSYDLFSAGPDRKAGTGDDIGNW